jgi:hypothetical protein
VHPWYQWGPGPPDPNALPPPGPADWSWCGGGTTGKLQFADTTEVPVDPWPWLADPNYPGYVYVTGLQSTPNHKMVDNIYGLPTASNPGTLYQAERQAPGAAEHSTALELEVYYGGETDNVVYTTQMEGRIYKLVGPKNLGYRRRAGQPSAGAKVSGYAGTEVSLNPNNRYAADFDSGFPTVGDDPNAVPPAPHGRGITSTELFSDYGNTHGRHYLGLAVDAGGRVYAVSERLVDSVSGIEPALKYAGVGADVWNADPGLLGPYTITDTAAAPFDGVQVAVGDVVIFLSGTGVNTGPTFMILAISGDATIAKLDKDPGDSQTAFDVGYRVYPAGTRPRPSNVKVVESDPNTSPANVSNGGPDPNDPNNVIPPYVLTDLTKNFVAAGVVAGDIVDLPYQANSSWRSGTYTIQPGGVTATTVTVGSNMGDSAGAGHVPYQIYQRAPGVWKSEAYLDVYKKDGTLLYSKDLNTLVRPDGVALSAYTYDPNGLAVPGIIVHGDVEIDPTFGQWDTPRLWIVCAGGDGDPATNDGLDLLVVDVEIDYFGDVTGASFVGGVDDADLPTGPFYQGNYSTDGWDPFGLWVCYGDLEFDGSDNLVYMAGGGDSANAYAGVTATELAAAASTIETETSLCEDAVVGINAFNLDMDLYGFGTDFGLAFDNSPLDNPPPPPPPPTHLVSSEPPADGTLPRTQRNCILLTFNGPITLPAGPALSIVTLAPPHTDVGASFTYTIEPDGVTLKAKENGAALTNLTWYRVMPGLGLYVFPFALDLCTLQGDADISGRVLVPDYFAVKNNMVWPPDDCARWDLDGDGRMLALDYFIVKNHIGDIKPPKP